jgi:hypothetical protein
VIYLSSVDYSLIGDDEVAEMNFGPHDAVFQRPNDSENHWKPLYIWGTSHSQVDVVFLFQEDGHVRQGADRDQHDDQRCWWW